MLLTIFFLGDLTWIEILLQEVLYAIAYCFIGFTLRLRDSNDGSLNDMDLDPNIDSDNNPTVIVIEYPGTVSNRELALGVRCDTDVALMLQENKSVNNEEIHPEEE